MREILFRGKRVENGEWVYGYYAKSVWETGLLSNPIIRTSHQIWYDMDNRHQVYAEIIPETVGEWTGLTDKNGVKIFEGDIVKNSRDVGLLYYKEKNSAFTVKGWEYGYWLWHDKEDIEVIGNIYDNKDLLKED